MSNASISLALEQALAHHQSGRLREAEAVYRQILANQPDHPDALHLLGLLAQQVGQHAPAADLLKRAAAQKPNDAELLAPLGASLGITGKREEAAVALRRAVQLDPRHFDAWNNLGNVLRDAGKTTDAIACFNNALAIQPQLFEARANRGQALLEVGQPDLAIDDLLLATRLRPEHVDARRSLGFAFLAGKRYEQCLEVLGRLIATGSARAQDHYNLGVALDETDRRDEALARYREALRLDPNLAEAHFNLGACLSMGVDVMSALRHFHQAWILKELPAAGDMFLHFQHHLPNASPQEIFEHHVRWGEQVSSTLEAPTRRHANAPDPERRLRIGYVSADFRRHSVAYFIEPLLAEHDRTSFEVFCYADQLRLDEVTARLHSHAEFWRNITSQSDGDAADLIRADDIDILIDLAGHSQNNRLRVFARRPAPIQVTYLGYPDTTGLSAIGYRLTDALADPPGMTDAFCVEKLIQMPDCAWCYRPDATAPEIEPDHHDDIVFGSFNAASKINDQVIALWASILRAWPRSRMMIKTGHAIARLAHHRIREAFAREGIDSDRICLEGFVSNPIEHLSRYGAVDIALDTFPYHGTTTTCEAMWMGVPVVTLAGKTHASRVGVSLLTNADLADLVAESPQHYVEIALRLADNSSRRKAMRLCLRDQLRASPLLNAKRFVRNVETAFREMWRQWCMARQDQARG